MQIRRVFRTFVSFILLVSACHTSGVGFDPPSLRDFQRRGTTLLPAFAASCYNARMTLMEITYELQSPLQPEQLRALGSFANTYGLRRFRVHEETNRLTLEYDASRLKETEVEHVLREARIAVLRRVEPVATVSQI